MYRTRQGSELRLTTRKKCAAHASFDCDLVSHSRLIRDGETAELHAPRVS
jgi:hypothetical protein